jgi:hypothetical protein
MLRKDLLMRQFEEFAKVMAVILGFKRQNDFEKFEKEIADAAKKFTPFEIETVENLSSEEFNREILGHPAALPEQYRILADLLFERIKYYLERGDENKVPDLKVKCGLLYKKFTDTFTHTEFNLDVHYRQQFLDSL